MASERVSNTVAGGLSATASVAGEVYTAALDWKNNSEFSNWLTDNLSNQHATLASKAMDAEYLRTHIGGGWHRLYDDGHSLVGSWKAVSSSLPDLGALDQLGVWANEYWKDLITTRGMPILILDHADQVSEYFKHLDCVNVAELIGGEVCGVSIYCNWNDPAKLVASATATECSGIVFANVVAPLAWCADGFPRIETPRRPAERATQAMRAHLEENGFAYLCTDSVDHAIAWLKDAGILRGGFTVQ